MENFGVIKQEARTFEGEKIIVRKVNELDVRKQYQIDITKSIRLIIHTVSDLYYKQYQIDITDSIRLILQTVSD